MTVMDISEAAKKLLDFNQQLDIPALDQIINCMHHGRAEQQKEAQQVLTQLKEHPQMWSRVDAVLEYSTNINTKYFALQILEEAVTKRWKTLPREQCDGIKSFIVKLIIATSTDPALLEQNKVFVSKLNIVLVQIVKREWPKNWPTFISDLVGSSRSNESLCQNNMQILKLLSEEVFDFSQGQMTQTRAFYLKQHFCQEFKAVFDLCDIVLKSSENVSLVQSTLETLLAFLNWIPLGYIFETDLIEVLVERFLNVPVFRNTTLSCLTEIAGVSLGVDKPDQYNDKLIELYTLTMTKIRALVPDASTIPTHYKNGSDSDQKFVSHLALFFSTYLREHGKRVEAYNDTLQANAAPAVRAVDRYPELVEAMEYMLSISNVDDVEVFKIALDYWVWLVGDLYRESPTGTMVQEFGGYLTRHQDPLRRTHGGGIEFGGYDSGAPLAGSTRARAYSQVMAKLRWVVIGRMAKPEEVLVVENDQGEMVRESFKDTDSINLYKTMRETLVYLTHLDPNDTESMMIEKLAKQVDGTEWSWKNLNTLCWAVGSISGAFPEEEEKRFLVTVIRDLLGLCEQKRGKDNKACIASNIMYVVGQYPRFLRAHYKFLKTVVNKLFEFMHETHEGVQDMAVDTFIKIAQKTKRCFVLQQIGEASPFIDEILEQLNGILCDLQPAQVHVFYEAVGCIIAAQSDNATRENLIERLMALPNQTWDDYIQMATSNIESLKDHDVVRNLSNILKTNVAASKMIGHPFIVQLSRIYLDMLNVYKVMSENVSNAVATHGEQILKQPLIKSMRGVKTETLRLITTWVSRSEDTPQFRETLVVPLFDAVLFDYQRNVADAREPDVLSTVTAIVNKLQSGVNGEIPTIFDALFLCTLDMISKEFQNYPEHRTNFFLLLKSVNEHCFETLMNLSAEQFKLVLDAIVWALKHSMRNVVETGLEILHRLLLNFTQHQNSPMAQRFYSEMFLDLLDHVFAFVTDSTMVQVAGISHYSTILAIMFHQVEENCIQQQLHPPQTNVEYVAEHIAELLQKHFPMLNRDQIQVTVKGFFSFDCDPNKFKEHLRDFLVQIKEYSGDDTSDLFLEEREQQIAQAQAQKFAVPGMANPNDVMQD